MAAIILYATGIGAFIWAYLSFKGKVAGGIFGRYNLDLEEEKKRPDFKAESKVRAVCYFLGGVGSILLAVRQFSDKKWISLTIMITALIAISLGVIAGFIFGSREKRRRASRVAKVSLKDHENINNNFSATEIRIATLRFPIIFGCYVLLPLGVLGEIFYSVVLWDPERFENGTIETLYYIFVFVIGPCCWVINKMLPKMIFSYSNGIFSKERNGKIESFPATTITKVTIESPVMPDYIRFYLQGQKKPIRISMKGFGQDDRFDIPRKVMRITKMKLTRVEQRILDEISEDK